jgi:hypothetical protein
MLITSATTVNTVRNLSIQEIETYKKQFQSFWIPFMEQFIPATTIWVAGERWCNEPCPIVNTCEFELTSSEITIEKIPPYFFENPKEKGPRGGYEVPKSQASSVAAMGAPKGTQPTSSPNIVKTQDLGQTITTELVRTEEETNINIAGYRNKFTAIETQVI